MPPLFRRYKLLLLSPRQRFINYPAHSEMARMFGKRRFMVPLALPTVAALTPAHYDIRICDEEIEEIPAALKPDIVGITTLAATIERAYTLADRYRRLGAKVVLGGPYASFMTGEALAHCDAVVVGEAEEKWERCLEDFESGQLQRIYESSTYTGYNTQKPPRWDLVNMKRIFQVAIQVSRGCPFNCDFCLVSKNFGRKMRYREIENVVEEIRAAPSAYFFFVDDNLTINKRYAKELMKAIIPLKISWGCMCSLDVATDDELLRLMAEAGCFNILVGFESLNPESLDESRKHHNRGGSIYADAIRKIHAAGIHINASFVVGFDHDDLSEFDRICDFTMEHSLPNVNLHLLNAAPGTETFKKLKAEGRLVNCSPELGVGHFPTIHYMNMSQIAIFDKYMETVARLYSFDTVKKKAVSLFSSGAFTRKGGDIPVWLKARLSWITFREFILTSDKDRKELFRYIFRLIRNRKLAVDKGLGYLLSMLGYHRHVKEHHKRMEEYRNMVIAQDEGPWRDRELPAGTIGVIGEGKMGSNLLYFLMEYGLRLRWVVSGQADPGTMRKSFEKKARRMKENGIISPEQASVLSETLIDADISIFGDCDLIIEAVAENKDLKKEVFLKLDKIAKPSCIFVSNSSSINPSEICPSEKRKENFAGLHFFFPVNMVSITEIIRMPGTSDQTLKRIRVFLSRIKKEQLLLGESSSFILNRIFLDVQNEAFRIVEMGESTIEEIDGIVSQALFPAGIFSFFDHVGIDIMLQSIKNYTKDYPHADYYQPLIRRLEEMSQQGRFGKKSGRGFYDWENDNVTKQESETESEKSAETLKHLEFTYRNAARRFLTHSGLTIDELNNALKEYFGTSKGPFDA